MRSEKRDLSISFFFSPTILPPLFSRIVLFKSEEERAEKAESEEDEILRLPWFSDWIKSNSLKRIEGSPLLEVTCVTFLDDPSAYRDRKLSYCYLHASYNTEPGPEE